MEELKKMSDPDELPGAKEIMKNVRGEYYLQGWLAPVPVCEGCHRMIHRDRNAPLSIDELKEIIAHERT